jgi:subtilisin
MTKKRQTKTRSVARRRNTEVALVSSSAEDLLLAVLERGGDSFETGRYLVTFKEGAAVEGLKSLTSRGFRVADTSDFNKRPQRRKAWLAQTPWCSARSGSRCSAVTRLSPG